MANINIPNPIWDSPEKLLKDFETFVAEQEPKRVTVLKNVKTKDDWSVQEVETVKEQGLVTISQFAAWKKIHRTTLILDIQLATTNLFTTSCFLFVKHIQSVVCMVQSATPLISSLQ